jgi:hypothetical protein
MRDKKTNQRNTCRFGHHTIPKTLRYGLIVAEGDVRLPVKVINMSSCGFLFHLVNVHHSLVGMIVHKGKPLTIEFPLIDETMKGICVQDTMLEKQNSLLRCFITNPHDQNVLFQLLRQEVPT